MCQKYCIDIFGTHNDFWSLTMLKSHVQDEDQCSQLMAVMQNAPFTKGALVCSIA